MVAIRCLRTTEFRSSRFALGKRRLFGARLRSLMWAGGVTGPFTNSSVLQLIRRVVFASMLKRSNTERRLSKRRRGSCRMRHRHPLRR